MAELTITTFLSLDGVMQAPGGPTEDTSGGFQHGGWVFPLADEDMGAIIDDIFGRATAFLLGRKTYDIFAAHWPRVTDPDDPVAAKLNSLPKHVASRTRTDFAWSASEVVRDVVQETGALKLRYDGEIQVHGSSDLAQTLIEHDLIDEYRLLTFPVVLGSGKRLFDGGARPRTLELVRTQPAQSGMVLSVYRRSGALKTGDFSLE